MDTKTQPEPSTQIEASKSKLEFKVWWVPQIPMKAFEYPVAGFEEGELLLDVLAKYDIFQLENNIKPDYSNAGGICYRHPDYTEGEWWDYDEAEFDEITKLLL